MHDGWGCGPGLALRQTAGGDTGSGAHPATGRSLRARALYASHALEAVFGLGPAGGFHDLEAVLLTLLFVASALVLLPRTGALLRYPRALPAFAGAVVLGGCSQALDSFAPVTRWEFVAEETLKLGAEALFLGGFLLVLSALRAHARGS